MLNHKFQMNPNARNKITFFRLIIGNRNLFRILCSVLMVFSPFVFIFKGYALNIDSVKVCFINGDYKAAIIEGEKVISGVSVHHGLDELYYILGLCYMKESNYLRAGDIFEIILKEFKNSGFKNEAKLGLADTYFLNGDYHKAEQEYENLLYNKGAQKLRPLVYQRLSGCALKSGDTRSADNYMKKLNDNFPLNIEPKLDSSLQPFDNGYSVQVGSFSSRTNAENLKQKLVNKGYSAFVEEGYSQGNKKIFRVKAGNFTSRQEASIAERKLSREGYAVKICP